MREKPERERPGKVPISQGITAHNIESAWVYGSLRQRKRIEEYGKLNRQILKALIHDEQNTAPR